MVIYCTSRYPNLAVAAQPPEMLYLGTDLEEAQRVLDPHATMTEGNPPTQFPELYCALPTTVERTVLAYYMNRQAWYSIVEFELKENA